MIDTDWRQNNKSLIDVLAVESNVMFAILSLIVLVAALNIISGLIMLVQDKARAIAVLRTMGATRGAILRIFLITGATIGVVGTFCGLGLGLLVAPQRRADPQRAQLSARRQSVPVRVLLPLGTALAHRDARRRGGRGDGAAAFDRRDDLSLLARGAARSGRGAAL